MTLVIVLVIVFFLGSWFGWGIRSIVFEAEKNDWWQKLPKADLPETEWDWPEDKEEK